MNRPTTTKLLALVLALMLTASACGDDDDSQVAVTDQADVDVVDPSEPASEATATEPSGASAEGDGSSGDVSADHDDADHNDDAEDRAEGHDDHGEGEAGHGAEDSHAEHGDAGDHAEDGDDGAEVEHGEHGDEGAAADGADDADITCGDNCPKPEALTAMETLVSAYNAGDWEAFTTAMGTGEPTWATGLGEASTEHIRADFEWAVALHQQMTLDGCVQIEAVLTCHVVIEDDIHRAAADFGLDPSRCKVIFEVQADLILAPARFEVTSCFVAYDFVFHLFGEWFETAYPDEEPISGFHYRGWNQFGEGAPARAARVIDEWIAASPEPG